MLDLTKLENDGLCVIENFIDTVTLKQLKDEANRIVNAFDPKTVSLFSTKNQNDTTDHYFLESDQAIHCFFEENAFNDNGTLKQEKSLSINKIGHAQHKLNPVFKAFSYQEKLQAYYKQLFKKANVLQSMYIFKQPHIGGEVVCHQDSTFLHTNPMSVKGFWFAIDDATVDNGCLWVEKGGHTTPLRKKFLCDRKNNTVKMETVSDMPWPVGEKLTPVEVKAGTLIVFDGLLPHMSYENTSANARHAYTLHVIDDACDYSQWNWIRK